jgi:hypothetical protein
MNHLWNEHSDDGILCRHSYVSKDLLRLDASSNKGVKLTRSRPTLSLHILKYLLSLSLFLSIPFASLNASRMNTNEWKGGEGP